MPIPMPRGKAQTARRADRGAGWPPARSHLVGHVPRPGRGWRGHGAGWAKLGTIARDSRAACWSHTLPVDSLVRMKPQSFPRSFRNE
jgi:hypothetical protein